MVNPRRNAYIHIPGLTMECHAVIPHPTAPAVCMVEEDGGWALPHFPSYEHFTPMVGAGLNRAIRARLGIDVRLLRRAHSQNLADSRQTHIVLVMDNRSPIVRPPTGMEWVDASAMADVRLARRQHRAGLCQWAEEAMGSPCPPKRSPWARPGWHAAADTWIGRELERAGATSAGPTEQVKTDDMSCVLRIPTLDGDLYFKASPETFAHETPVTSFLSRQRPNCSPRVIATDTEHHWTLMGDIGGTPLRHVADVDRWADALRDYAGQQMALVSTRGELAALGCPVRTLDVLAQAIPPLLADTDVVTLGGAEPGLSAAELDRLRDLAPAMRSACRALADYAVPESLTHGDFVSVNIIARGGDTVFFDWSHSSIAHPFFDLPFVLPQPTAGGPSDFYALTLTPAIRARLEDAYLTPWTSYEPMRRLRQALALARPLAALHYALTFYRYIVPTVEDAVEWGASVPRLLRVALADAESLRTHG